jgi:hypothetical protein
MAERVNVIWLNENYSNVSTVELADPNLPQLIAAAKVLQPLLEDLVFVGGCTTGLLVTDPGGAPIRATIDVDAVIEITSYVSYANLSVKLRDLGLTNDQDPAAPICRWKHGELTIDVMPLDESILGFSNRWYQQAIDSAQLIEIESGLAIRYIASTYFVATKLEAFRNRGKGVYLGSHDLEDVVSIIDGRESLGEEIAESDTGVASYVREEFNSMLENKTFIDALPGFLQPDDASQERAELILARMKSIVEG